MLSRFSMKEENPKPITSEKNQHNCNPERCLFEQTQENVCVSIVCRGKGELYFVKVF